MKFGVTTYLRTGDFTPASLDILPAIKAAGFHGVELPIFRSAGFEAAPIRRGLEAAGLECTVSCVLVDGYSLASDDKDLRRRTVAHLEEVARAASALGARMVAGPLYSPVGYRPGRRTGAEWRHVVESYRELGPALGEHDVTIAIERLNRFETHFLNTRTP